MPRSVTKNISGWGNLPVQRCKVFNPDGVAELEQTLRGGEPRGFIARGLGRSYGDASLNEDGGVVLSDLLARFISFDPKTGLLHCEAGVGLADVLEVFVPRGFFPPVTPGTKFVTIGGAIAADVHGKNHHRDGSFASFVDEFDLIDGRDRLLTCSRTQNPEAFWATLGGMGLTGVVVTAKIRLKPIETAYLNVDYSRAPNLDSALRQFLEGDGDYEYSVAWIDCLAAGPSLGRSVLIRGNPARLDQLPAKLRNKALDTPKRGGKTVPFQLPSWVLNPLTVKAFNATYYGQHKTRPGVLTHYDPFFYPLDSVHHWNRIYGKRGFVQYQAAVPPVGGREALIELLEKCTASKLASFLAVLKTFGEGNEGLLSFPIRGYTLALDLPNTGDKLRSLVDSLDQIVLKYGGRVYLAKDALLDAPRFARMYPRLEEFKKVKQTLDPQNRFASSLARRIGLAGAP
jgi:decaprenylphospho-beta-D-ribofuranose 2-oxidase